MIDEPSSSPPPLPGCGPSTPDRRLLLRGGLAGGAGLLTLAARPASAGVCRQASASASANASKPHPVEICGGKGVDFWKSETNFADWPAGTVPRAVQNGSKATYFKEAFSNASRYREMSLLEVLNLPSTAGMDGLAKLSVAAYLNARKGLTPDKVVGIAVVKNIWATSARNGFYEPTAGVKWYPDSATPGNTGGTIAWLMTTMTG